MGVRGKKYAGLLLAGNSVSQLGLRLSLRDTPQANDENNKRPLWSIPKKQIDMHGCDGMLFKETQTQNKFVGPNQLHIFLDTALQLIEMLE